MVFARLYEMISDYTFHLTLRKEGDKMMVMFVPKTNNKDADEKLIPLSIIATPEELDSQFTSIVSAGVQKLNAVITNLEEFSKIADQIDKKTEEKKTAKVTGKAVKKEEAAKPDLITQLQAQEPLKEEKPEKAPEKAPKVAKPVEIDTTEPMDDEPSEDLPGGNDEYGEEDW